MHIAFDRRADERCDCPPATPNLTGTSAVIAHDTPSSICRETAPRRIGEMRGDRLCWMHRPNEGSKARRPDVVPQWLAQTGSARLRRG